MMRNPQNKSQHTYQVSTAPVSCTANLSLFCLLSYCSQNNERTETERVSSEPWRDLVSSCGNFSGCSFKWELKCTVDGEECGSQKKASEGRGNRSRTDSFFRGVWATSVPDLSAADILGIIWEARDSLLAPIMGGTDTSLSDTQVLSTCVISIDLEFLIPTDHICSCR